jgi:hypothetical protein
MNFTNDYRSKMEFNHTRCRLSTAADNSGFLSDKYGRKHNQITIMSSRLKLASVIVWEAALRVGILGWGIGWEREGYI